MRKILFIFVTCVTWAQVTTVPDTGGGGSGTVTEVQAGTGVTVVNGTTTPTVSADLSVFPTKSTAAGTPTMAGQLTGSFAVDTSASPDRLYFCGADDGTDCTAVIRIAGYAEMLPLAGGTLTGQLITDNLGIEFEESDTNPTCASGNYTIYADTSETKLKACQNGVASDLVGGGSGGSARLVGYGAGNAITTNATRYHNQPNTGMSSSTEVIGGYTCPATGSITGFYLATIGADTANANAVITLRLGTLSGATMETMADTDYTVTITAGQAASQFLSDTSGTATCTIGYPITLKSVSSASSGTHATLGQWFIVITP